jgi:hypothetical protein
MYVLENKEIVVDNQDLIVRYLYNNNSYPKSFDSDMNELVTIKRMELKALRFTGPQGMIKIAPGDEVSQIVFNTLNFYKEELEHRGKRNSELSDEVFCLKHMNLWNRIKFLFKI